MICCGDFLKYISGHPGFTYRTSGKGQFSFFVLSSQKGGRKMGNVILESCGHILEETRRIQDLDQFLGR